jgi:hypothetical protein
MASTRPRKAHEPSIVGDVAAESVTINAKGGSLAAIFKRGIRGNLMPGKRSFGAKIEFEPGISCVLIAPGQIRSEGEERRFRVLKVPNGFVITLDDGAGEMVDTTTKAVLSIYEEMLKAGTAKLLSPDESERRLTSVLEKSKNLQAPAKIIRKDDPSRR